MPLRPQQFLHTLIVSKNAVVFPLLIILCLQFSSCVYQDHAEQIYLALPAKTPEQIEVYNEPPARNYELVADIQANGAPESFFKKRAARLGGDAIILKRVGGPVFTGAVSPTDTTMDWMYMRATASVIKFK